MTIGKQILNIRQKQNLTQEEFGKLFHVTRQTVSNWENEKSYPDLQTLVTISDLFEISLDTLLKGDHKMIARIDYERMYGSIKKRLSIINFFTGSGTGLLFSGLFSPDSVRRTITVCLGILMIGVGWYLQAKQNRKILEHLEQQAEDAAFEKD